MTETTDLTVSDNRKAAEGKGTSVVIMNIVGQMGPLVGTRLYPDDDAPYYVKGMFMCGFFMLLAGLLAWLLRVILGWENEVRKESVAYERIASDEETKPDADSESKVRRAKSGFTNIL